MGTLSSSEIRRRIAAEKIILNARTTSDNSVDLEGSHLSDRLRLRFVVCGLCVTH